MNLICSKCFSALAKKALTKTQSNTPSLQKSWEKLQHISAENELKASSHLSRINNPQWHVKDYADANSILKVFWQRHW